MKKLNYKQELFLQEYIANGLKGAEAYMTIYKTNSRKGAAVNAHKILNSEAGKAFMDNVRAQSDSIVVTRNKMVEETLGILKNAKDDLRYATALKAIELISKLEGFFKEDNNKNVDVNINFEFENLNDDEDEDL